LKGSNPILLLDRQLGSKVPFILDTSRLFD
jgi:hypothetical protein